MKEHFLRRNAMATTSTQSTALGNREITEKNQILETENKLKEMVNIQMEQITEGEEEKQNLQERIKEMKVCM